MGVYKKYRGKKVERQSPFYRKASWWAEGMVDGVRYHESLRKKGVKTREEAETEEDLIIASIRQGKYDIERKRTTYSDFVDKTYLPHALTHNAAYATKVFDTNVLKSYFKNLPLKQITPARCEAFKTWRVRQKKHCQKCFHKIEHECEAGTVSKSSANRELRTHSAILSLAVQHREISENPMAFVKEFPEPPPRDRLLSIEEKQKLLTEIRLNVQLSAIVILTLWTGWRKDQILHLKAEDLDEVFRAVKLKPSKKEKGRKIAVSQAVWDVLSFLAQRVGGTGWLFRNSRTGDRLKDFKKSWSLAVDKAGIKHFIFKDLRHQFASDMLASGADMRVIQAAMGHSVGSKITELYAQVRDENLRGRLDGLAEGDKIAKGLLKS